MNKVTYGSCAVGTPNNQTRYRGYIEIWDTDDKCPVMRLWCTRRLANETAYSDAESLFPLAYTMDGRVITMDNRTLYHTKRDVAIEIVKQANKDFYTK